MVIISLKNTLRKIIYYNILDTLIHVNVTVYIYEVHTKGSVMSVCVYVCVCVCKWLETEL